MTPLSLVVISKNAEAHIARCLKSVPFAAELLVLDSGSTDRTVEIAKAAGARVVQEEWRGFGAQKRRATELAKNDWILNLDADEALSDQAQAELRELLNGQPDTQTAYVLALQFDMLPENLRAQAADRLVRNIHRYDDHLTTGFLGTPYLCHVLSRFGHADVAYQLLLQDTYPSWLYPVKMGATTVWERWDGIKPDGTFETPTMNSYNHYAYGAIGDWMYRVIAGIDTKTEGAGYKQIIIKPTIGGKLDSVKADYETNYGKVNSHWKVTNGAVSLEVTIPANTTATVYIPAKAGSSLLEGGQPAANNPEIKAAAAEPGYLVVNVGSGIYHFSTAATQP